MSVEFKVGDVIEGLMVSGITVRQRNEIIRKINEYIGEHQRERPGTSIPLTSLQSSARLVDHESDDDDHDEVNSTDDEEEDELDPVEEEKYQEYLVARDDLAARDGIVAWNTMLGVHGRERAARVGLVENSFNFYNSWNSARGSCNNWIRYYVKKLPSMFWKLMIFLGGNLWDMMQISAFFVWSTTKLTNAVIASFCRVQYAKFGIWWADFKVRLSRFWTALKESVVKEPALYVVAVIFVGIIFYLIYDFSKSKKKAKEQNYSVANNQSFINGKNAAMLQIGLFMISLVNFGSLAFWSKWQPWLRLVGWMEKLFGDTKCSNFPDCKKADSLGDSMCSKCALDKAQSQSVNQRSYVSVVRNPDLAFKNLVNDIYHQKDSTWFGLVDHLQQQSILKDLYPNYPEFTINGIFQDSGCLFVRSGKHFDMKGQFPVNAVFNNPALGKGFLCTRVMVSANADATGFVRPGQWMLKYKMSLDGEEITTPAPPAWGNCPAGVKTFYFKYETGVERLFYVVDDIDESLPFANDVKNWFQDMNFRNSHFYIIGFLCIFLAVWMSYTRWEKIQGYICKTYSWFYYLVFRKDEDESDGVNEGHGDLVRFRDRAAHRDRFQRPDPRPAQWNQRERRSGDDFKITPETKRYFFYDGNDLMKAARGLSGLPMTHKDDGKHVVYVRTREEYQTLSDAGFSPYIQTNNHVTIPWDAYSKDKHAWKAIFKTINWWHNYPNSTIGLESNLKALYNSEMERARFLNQDFERNVVYPKWANKPEAANSAEKRAYREYLNSDYTLVDVNQVFPDESVDSVFNQPYRPLRRPNGIIFTGPQEVTDWREYRRSKKDGESSDGKEESNVNDVDTDMCVYEIALDKPCLRKNCLRKHRFEASKKFREESGFDETIRYPVKTPLDDDCVYGVYYDSEMGQHKTGTAVAIGSDFITCAHVLLEEGKVRGGDIRKFSIYDRKTNQYKRLSAIDPGSVKEVENVHRWTWDFCKFKCEDKDFMINSRSSLARIGPYSDNLTMELRMLKIDPRNGKPYTESGPRLNVQENLMAYAINTEKGDSGSPLFDVTGRIVGLHKKGDLNSAVLFSLDGKIPLWFQSQSPSKNYQSPITPC